MKCFRLESADIMGFATSWDSALLFLNGDEGLMELFDFELVLVVIFSKPPHGLGYG